MRGEYPLFGGEGLVLKNAESPEISSLSLLKDRSKLKVAADFTSELPML